MLKNHRQTHMNIGENLMDIDVPYKLVKAGYLHYAKVKDGIIHLFASDLKTYSMKVYTRSRDYFYYNKRSNRSYPWKYHSSKLSKMIFSMIGVVPSLLELQKGLKNRKDVAWFYHPLILWITIVCYGLGAVRSMFD